MPMRLVFLAVVCFVVSATSGPPRHLAADDSAKPTGGAAAAPPASFEQKALAALDRPGNWEFLDQPLNEVAAFIQDGAGIDVILDRPALDDYGIPGDVPVTFHAQGMRLRSCLNLMLRQLGMTWELRDNAMWITTPEAAEGRLSLRTYPVADLIRVSPAAGESAYDYQSVISAITTTIDPDSWDNVGGPGAIEGIYGALVVSQTRDIQDRIGCFLAAYRKAVGQLERPGEAILALNVEQDNPTHERIRAALDAPITLDFLEAPLKDVVEFVSDSTDIAVFVDARALEEVGIEVSEVITVRAKKIPLRSALRRMLHELFLTWYIRDDALVITAPEEAEQKLSLVLYPVHDLVKVASAAGAEGKTHDFDTLIGVITSCVQPDSWDEVGGPGAMEVLARPPLLAISQTEQVHEKIQALVHRLRRAKQTEQQVVAAPGAAAGSILLSSRIQAYPLVPGKDGSSRFPANQVIELIREAIGPSAWDQQSDAFVRAVGNTVVIRHTEQVHRKVQQLLTQIGVWGGDRFGVGQSGPYHGGIGTGGMGGFGGGGFK